ncbi:AAA family ATPase [Marinifilum sp. N1E240]|uniref:UvrD-helicase domain-containing protein n=1 Tax=Marinifilum sp. N1E240 TaxID=2608082 RepID=UPI00128BC877|nr:UvrD-helicase domain-containing protein [Marinifilum sp. N1E240]MPQ49288.1 AAA family ATPase [Marinifilum sp. N1E240]
MSAFENISKLIDDKHSFVLEAGAGSGKTYTLIQSINYILNEKEAELKLNNQHIVCITYTNVAKNEVIERLENNPLVLVSTIHEFLWDCIKRFNKQLIIELDVLNEVMCKEKPEKFESGLKERISSVTYDDSGFRDFEKGKLHHDDVISLSLQMFKNYTSLTQILGQKYPYILIDEYQDTAEETISALIDFLLKRNVNDVLLGFYGDSYQKIYDEGVGSLQSYVDSGDLSLITKDENYRSSQNVIKLLNNIRDNITQITPEGIESPLGSVKFINTTHPQKEKKEKVKDYEARVQPKKEQVYTNLVGELERDGWDFGENGKDKILIIVNSKVAQQAGFGNLYKVYSKRYFDPKESLLKRENQFASFFMGSMDKKTSKERETGIEHLSEFWKNKDYNNVIRFLKRNGNFSLKIHTDKTKTAKILDELNELRKAGTIKDVFEFCTSNALNLLSQSLSNFLKRISLNIDEIEDEELKKRIQKDKDFYEQLMAVNYKEFIYAFKHIQDQTAYSTKHGTKGEEYRNVLVVIDDTSWKQKYNFQNFFSSSEEKEDRELRTKNLFYVSCSRAVENLVVLALSEMNDVSMGVLGSWFNNENVEIK